MVHCLRDRKYRARRREGVAEVLEELDNYYKKKSYYNWEKAIYRWRYEFKKLGSTLNMPSIKECQNGHETKTAGPITTFANIDAILATWIKDKRKNKVKVTRLSICNVALEMEPTLCGGISADYEEQVRFSRRL